MAKRANFDLSVMMPGTTVLLPTYNPAEPTIEVVVMPLSVRHLRSFSDGLTKVLQVAFSAIGSLEETDRANETAAVVKILPVLIPVAVRELVPLISECVHGVDLLDERCPAEWFAILAERWLLDSFGSEARIRPWKALLAQVEERTAALRSSPSSQTSPSTDTPSAT